uniref:Pentatricopeptide repeat-containing protein n=1 Tax=Populus alba TaxID=43335 RepID=A0A4U5NR04_POPAL|nr:hypothetical protein D5086_0000246980 [Populus alba]
MRGVFVPSAVQKTTLIADHSKGFSSKKIFGIFRSLGSSNVVLLRKLEVALQDHQVDEAWITSIDFKNLYGFPMGSKMCDGFLPLSSKRSVHAKVVKPDAMALNQVLDACVRCYCQCTLAIIVAQIHEMNGQRDGIKKLKDKVEKPWQSLSMDTEDMGELLSFQSFYFAFNRTFMHSASPVYVLMLTDSCVHLGWLEMAHDILNEMDAAGLGIP